MKNNEVFVIEGGSRLTGKVNISGAKNAVLPVLASSLLFDKPFEITNIPRVIDIYTMLELLSVIGTQYEWIGKNSIKLYPDIKNQIAPYGIVEKMRASIYVLGPLLAKTGFAKVSFPGGCNFGPRPINFHLEGLKKFGAKIEIEHGFIVSRASRLHGAKIVFDQKTVGGTIHLLMTAALVEDETVLQNVALEPEVEQVAELLKSSGVEIENIGGEVLRVRGVKTLTPPSTIEIIPDRIEAGTFMVIALATHSDIRVENIKPNHTSSVLEKLEESGAGIEIGESYVRVYPKSEKISPLIIQTSPYPGFPTDMQPQFMALLSVADGMSIVRETIYPSRFHHAYELQRMGANIQVKDGEAIIRGVSSLEGTVVNASDLRAAASLVIAGLMARGKTIVRNIYHLDRGYEDFEYKLSKLGAKIKRKKEM